MPFANINGARLYYEIFGQDVPDQAPILLIHGSTGTGQSDWSLVAPLLAQRYRVIVIDCRGHGQSTNPNMTYSFLELAADNAELIRTLGYQRAHIIGHSNGGNVALVTLLEHPEVVQTAILQAANAYVSQDLIEKEPALFDPDRVAREAPEWVEDMLALHSSTHGKDYWRDLLQLTVKEIISQPNYSSEDLSRVERPSLVIQGEHDGVNAPARHAQFIARHIQNSELWIPSGIGHNVHKEILFTWVEHILDFLERRGDDFNEELYRLRLEQYPDNRRAIFDIHASVDTSKIPQQVTLTGQVLSVDQRLAAIESIIAVGDKKGDPQVQLSISQVRTLLNDETPWALVNRSVTDLRRVPRNLSERVSQALIGEVVRILEDRGDWCWIRLENDGYMGWVHTASLYRCEYDQITAYQNSCNALIIDQLLSTSSHPDGVTQDGIHDQAGKLPFGVCLPVETRQEARVGIRLPDQRIWWVSPSGLLPIEERPNADPEGIAFTLNLLDKFVGIPYLWGGRTPFGYDCSGFSQAFMRFMGLHIPRDADQQFQAGEPVEPPALPGDLLFFGEPDETHNDRFASISHVAVSLGGDEMIHANGTAWSVSYNSLHPNSSNYSAYLHKHLAGIRRFR